MVAQILNPFYGLALANLASFAYIFVVLTHPAQKQKFISLPKGVQKGLVFINVGTAWAMALLPQERLDLPAPVVVGLGGGLLAIAVTVWVSALLRIGLIPSIRSKERVITSGIYSLVRHPIYLGNLLFPLGLAIAARAAAALLYLPVLVIFYAALTVVEEASLEAEYGEAYQRYQEKVRSRLIPFVF